MKELGLSDAQALALGAGILGTGGGGNTYLGRIWLEQEFVRSKNLCPVIDADDVDDNALICAIGTMGAPTVAVEKLPRGDELEKAVRTLESHLRAKFDAIAIGEIGGANALKPIICALQMGLPVVDGDPMGRAFPELQMDTFAIGGLDLSPLALVDCHGNQIILESVSGPLQAELYARNLTIEMGGSVALAMPVVTGAELKKFIIRKTLSLSIAIGNAVLKARGEGSDPVEPIISLTKGQVLFRGKIIDVERRTTKGFSKGSMRLSAFGDQNDQLEIEFQNENLIAHRNGRTVCTVPDLISLVNVEDGEPIGTEMLRYGLRVAVIGMPAPEELKTSRALEFVDPEAFGYSGVEFKQLAGKLLQSLNEEGISRRSVPTV